MPTSNWYFFVKEKLKSLDLDHFTNGSFECSKSNFSLHVTNKVEQKHQVDWLNVVQGNIGSREHGGNKLRTYCLFNYHVQPYCQMFCRLNAEVRCLNFDVG